jgi:hypothetical protein
MEEPRSRTLALAAMLIVGTAGISWAGPVGTAFTYQGQLKESGSPANGTYDFKFALYDDPDFGSQVNGIVDIADQQVTNGLFTVQLDFGNVYNGTALWLWVLVRPGDSSGAYTQLWPRQPLTATPYALYALDAAEDGGGIGGSGTPNFVPKFTDATTIADSVLYETSGNVGIGTTTPGEKLDVDGGIQASGTIKSGNSITIDGTLNTISSDADLELHVSSGRGLRIEPHSQSPNLVGGFAGNSANGVGNTVSGGGSDTRPNVAGDNYTTNWAAIGGGQGNVANGGDNATVGGGFENVASADCATVCGGYQNTASGEKATACGYKNVASGDKAFVTGANNKAAGECSFAAGEEAEALHSGAFVWSDAGSGPTVQSTGTNQWIVRAQGGVWFYSDSQMSAGVRLAPNGSQWLSVSDHNAKERFEGVDPVSVLKHLTTVPIETWNYKSQDPSIRHIGPMAQDFYAAFAVGEDDKHIGTIDADGVALAAIQGLHKLLNEQQNVIDAQRSCIDDLEARLRALEEGVKSARQ